MVILVDQYNLPEDIFEIIFATSQQKIVAKILVNTFKENNSELTKSEMSLFATKLHEGNLITTIDEEPFRGKQVKLSYNKRQFYDRILTPMRSMGLIDYDLYKKTYKLSENFNKLMMQIGLMWTTEVRKQNAGFKIKAEHN
ncbi:MAG TPA: hypothetical protein VJI97_00505 [Candidatus Nanoarchaeia archaeon]|nr:hypothetical protein [Candidatus Nanoarchaeia archaeon]